MTPRVSSRIRAIIVSYLNLSRSIGTDKGNKYKAEKTIEGYDEVSSPRRTSQRRAARADVYPCLSRMLLCLWMS